MPLKGTPICIKCNSNDSPVWTNCENLGAICLNCVNAAKDEIQSDPVDDDECDEKIIIQKPINRRPRTARACKIQRSSPLSGGTQSQPAPPTVPAQKSAPPKGRGRRTLFKGTPVRAPASIVTTVTSNYVFHKGSYLQIGDIVALQDEDGGHYYGQIKGFLTDQYCEKSAVITWLLPTRFSPHPDEGFDPATYIIGPEEDVPRKLDCMEFVMHAPSDYYKSPNTPYPVVQPPGKPGYIWSTLETISKLTNKLP